MVEYVMIRFRRSVFSPTEDGFIDPAVNRGDLAGVPPENALSSGHRPDSPLVPTSCARRSCPCPKIVSGRAVRARVSASHGHGHGHRLRLGTGTTGTGTGFAWARARRARSTGVVKQPGRCPENAQSFGSWLLRVSQKTVRRGCRLSGCRGVELYEVSKV